MILGDERRAPVRRDQGEHRVEPDAGAGPALVEGAQREVAGEGEEERCGSPAILLLISPEMKYLASNLVNISESFTLRLESISKIMSDGTNPGVREEKKKSLK